jgi:hypothetical protein
VSKTATWVRKEQRSAQYYGLRNDYQWCMSDKTRDPVEALQQAFGDDLDVVTMLALEPKPVDRDWTRFEESMEIVDLGRNYREGRRALKKLNGQASVERNLHTQADPSHIEAARQSITEYQQMEERRDMKAALETEGLRGLLTHYHFNDWAEAELFTVALEGDIGELSGQELRDWLEERRSEHVERVMEAAPNGHYLGDNFMAMALQASASRIVGQIDEWIDRLDTVLEVQREIAERKRRRDAMKKLRALDCLDA